MMISCPSCPKVYRVSASAIPPEGREVRCEHCQTVWHESGIVAENIDPPELVDAEPSVDIHTARLVFQRLLADAQVQIEPEPLQADEPAIWEDVPAGETESFDSASEPDPNGNDGRIGTELTIAEPFSAPVIDGPVIDGPDPVVIEGIGARPAQRRGHPRRNQHVVRKTGTALVDRVKLHWQQWREDYERAEAVPPGNKAAQNFRDQSRERDRNRLTPLRVAGWGAWAAGIAATGHLILTDRALVETVFPPSATLYARLSAPEPAAMQLTDIATRYVESTVGPVLEIRGTVVNQGDDQSVPTFELAATGAAGTQRQPLAMSDVPLPSGASRPFIVRAQVPEGTDQAALHVVPAADLPNEGRYVMQRIGSGWGDAGSSSAVSVNSH